MDMLRHKAYQQASHTVAKTRQVVMLYDGMIRFMNQAKEAIESGDIMRIEERYQKLTKVTDIIAGLQACLDFNAGQEMSSVLYSFYASIERRVFNLHHAPDATVCAQIIAELKEMREVWNTIDRPDATDSSTNSAMPPSPATIDPITVSV